MSILSKKTITLDTTSNAIRLLMIKGNRVDRWASAPIEPGLVKDGIVTDVEAMGEAIKQLMKSSGIDGKKVVASISGLYSVSRVVNLPKPNGHSTEETMAELISEIVPLPLDEIYTSWKVVSSNGNGRKALFFGTPADVIDAEINALILANVKPSGLNLKSMALLKLIDKQQAIVANIEVDCADIIIIADGLPQVTRTVRRNIDTDTEEWVNDVETNIEQTILFYNTRFHGKHLAPDAPLYLTGMMAEKPSIQERLTNLTGCTLESLSVPLECPSNLPIGQFAVNIGLALKQPYTLPVIEHADFEVEDVEQ
ncbi:type IV pilus biogenesis protein PilM [Chloroflexota bacterium]